MSLVHLNTAGAGLMSAATVEAMRGFIDGEAGQGSYETELQYADLLGHGLYERAAQMLNAPRANIGLFSSATEAWAGILSKLEFPLGCRVWVSSSEYAANLIFFNFLKQSRGVRVEVIPRTAQSPLDLDWVRRHLGGDVFLVSVSHIPSCCGVVNPVEALGAILREHPAYYVVDACQSMGQLALDVRDMHCDLLTGAGRKFLCGPRGSGIAYVSNRLLGDLTLNFADLHTARTNGQVNRIDVLDARVLEIAEKSFSALVGLHQALGEYLADRERLANEAYTLLSSELARLPGLRLLCAEYRQSGIVSFVPERGTAQEFVARAREAGVNLWAGTAAHTPLLLADLPASHFVRASVGRRVSVAQVELALERIRPLL
ncbi:aminotransferase class V-fold PLP-dependent enzyme [Pseudomonas sp. MPFS]|uniref:aminotransferase class V-fold PLP-dependent enzyme n=1 Tax=Pseudomonas sp. MPFS TaxID=2795724 RepID=UPI001F13F1C9|nr:aminotransferase class V-fold PLP-dependent enzyme [Pseudomonas sp. MPFS]UMZ10981.1 aminotransferase class V-fold PLP-dependent enzyme [Pseudomonas sp. MPFS]